MKVISKFSGIQKKKLRISLLSIVFVVSAIGLVLIPTYTRKVRTFVEKESVVILKNVSSQNIINLNENISTRQDLLKFIANNIEERKNFNIENIIQILKLYDKINGFYNFGIIDENGICYTTLGEKIDLSKEEYFINGMKGIGGITNGYFSKNKKEILNIFTVPIYNENKVQMLLTATYKSSYFSELINTESFEGNGQSIVINSKGQLVSSAEDVDNTHLYENSNIRHEMLEAINEKINYDDEGIINYEFHGEEYLGYCEKVGIQDWTLVSYVPKKIIYKNIDIINDMIISENLLACFGIIALLVVMFIEYSKYKKKISKIVFYDELTNEKNYEYLKLYFEDMKPEEKKDKYLVVMDIDKFKSINIMHGSDIGNEILKYIPSVFKELLPNDEIFRYQGDIFIAVLNGKSKEEIREKVHKIKMRIKQDVEENLIVTMGLSFGVCHLEEFDDLYSIYNNALISKNEIKGNINNKINFFNEDSKKKVIENREIEAKFMDALKNDEFEVWYQPKYYIDTNKIYGSEALVRWRENNGQLVSPAKFIPVLENSGQIIELDKAVIEMTFKDIKEMKSLGLQVKPISINLSRVHVECLGIIREIKELKEKYKINPKYVSFEITESALIENNDLINKIISKLHEMGFEVNIDDYGIGNSTLNALYASEFDILKLDKSFVDNIGNKKMETIIKSTVHMAHELNMEIIAEGVETKEQVDFLMQHGCNIVQGYYFSKPLDKPSYFELLKKEE